MDELKFELRGLKSDDMFSMFAILSKIGFKDFMTSLTPDRLTELANGFKKMNDSETVDMSAYVGVNIAFEVVEVVFKNLPSCKNEIYSLLSSLSGMSVKEISNLDMVTFTEMIVAVIKKEEFKDFFKAVAKLFN